MRRSLHLISAAFTSQLLVAQALDPGFGDAGIAIHDLGQAERVFDAGLDASGRILVAGNTEPEDDENDFLLARFNSDGTLDASFGSGGWLVAAEFGVQTSAAAVAEQADGRILALGWRSTGAISRCFVRRYMPDGVLDPAFGSAGEWESDLNDRENPAALGLLPDGRILVGGARILASGVTRPFVYRLNANGTLDAAFGSNGATEVPFGAGFHSFGDMVVHADGRITISGNTAFSSAFLARFEANGSPDASFDADGLLLIEDSPAVEEAWRMAMRADGRIVAAVGRYGSVGEVWLYLVDEDGSLLPYGGTAGVNSMVAADWYIADLELDAAERALMPGYVIGSPIDQGVLCRAVDAAPDLSFGTNGTVVLPITENPAARKLLQRPDGRVLVVGHGAQADNDELDVWMVQYANLPAAIGERALGSPLRVMPNPVHEALTIRSDEPIANSAALSVRDMTGREVFAEADRRIDHVIVDASRLPAGAYTVTISTNEGQRTARFIKQ